MLEIEYTDQDKLVSDFYTFFGNKGVGKTYLAATFPDPLFIFTEHGDTTLKGFKYPKIQIKDFTHFLNQFEEIIASTEKEFPYKTIILDTATGLAEMILADIERTISFPKSWTAYATEFMRVMNEFIKFGKERGINIVYLYHEDIQIITEKEGSSYEKRMISFPGNKLTGLITRNVDIVGYLFVDDKGYNCLFKPNTTRLPQVKSRYSTLSESIMTDPTYTKIKEKIDECIEQRKTKQHI
jgi:hypothetical protein